MFKCYIRADMEDNGFIAKRGERKVKYFYLSSTKSGQSSEESRKVLWFVLSCWAANSQSHFTHISHSYILKLLVFQTFIFETG